MNGLWQATDSGHDIGCSHQEAVAIVMAATTERLLGLHLPLLRVHWLSAHWTLKVQVQHGRGEAKGVDGFALGHGRERQG